MSTATMVPAIPSAALPQTPAADWADSTNDVLGGHVTRTPLGTPGPTPPGGFPDAIAEERRYDEAAKQETLLETAKGYLPAQTDVARALEAAKAYLPQGVAAYFPSTEALDNTASLPPLPPSNASLPRAGPDTAVDVGHGASVPYTASAPEPYSSTDLSTRNSTNSSTAVDVGHGTSVPYTASAPEPYSTTDLSARNSTNSSTAVDVGHGASVPYTASAPEPYSTTDLPAPTRDESTLVHTGHSSTSVPAAASGLLPSHPAAPGASQSDFPTPPPASTEDSFLASTPSLSGGGDADADSGYAASSESALVETPSSMSVATPSSMSVTTPSPMSLASPTSQSEGPPAPSNSLATPSPFTSPSNANAPATGPNFAKTGSAALNSSDPKDLFPADTPGFDELRAAHSNANPASAPTPSTGSNFAKTGSDALNSSDPKDLFPADTPGFDELRAAHLASSPGSKTRVERKATNPSTNPNDVFPVSSTPAASQSAAPHVLGGNSSEPKGLPSVPASEPEEEEAEEGTSGDGSGDGTGASGEKSGKKPKLIQRLKEKMHVGHAS